MSGAEGGFNMDRFPPVPGSVLSVDGEIFPLHHHVVTQR